MPPGGVRRTGRRLIHRPTPSLQALEARASPKRKRTLGAGRGILSGSPGHLAQGILYSMKRLAVNVLAAFALCVLSVALGLLLVPDLSWASVLES
jgi:hypothetical protein